MSANITDYPPKPKFLNHVSLQPDVADLDFFRFLNASRVETEQLFETVLLNLARWENQTNSFGQK